MKLVFLPFLVAGTAFSELARINVPYFKANQCAACAGAAQAIGAVVERNPDLVRVAEKSLAEHDIEAAALGVATAPAIPEG